MQKWSNFSKSVTEVGPKHTEPRTIRPQPHLQQLGNSKFNLIVAAIMASNVINSAFDSINSYDLFTQKPGESAQLGSGHVCLKRTIMVCLIVISVLFAHPLMHVASFCLVLCDFGSTQAVNAFFLVNILNFWTKCCIFNVSFVAVLIDANLLSASRHHLGLCRLSWCVQSFFHTQLPQ
jgi:hypothetical protein